MNVSDAIRLKRAVRKFQDKPLPEDVNSCHFERGTQVTVI